MSNEYFYSYFMSCQSERLQRKSARKFVRNSMLAFLFSFSYRFILACVEDILNPRYIELFPSFGLERKVRLQRTLVIFCSEPEEERIVSYNAM